MHYSARAGNTDLMLEIVKQMDPNKIQAAVNKQAKVGSLLLIFIYKNYEILVE